MAPDLKKHFTMYEFKEDFTKLAYKPKGSLITTLTSQAKKQDGLKPTKAILDEFHEHPNLALYNVILFGPAPT